MRTYVRTLKQSINQPTILPKKHTTLVVDSSIDNAVAFLASFFGTDKSSLYVEGVLLKVEALIDKLPENIQLSLVRQTFEKQDADPEILGVKIDLITQELQYAIERVRRAPERSFNVNYLRKQLAQSFRLASTSGDESLKRLVFEAKELLRRPSTIEEVKAPAKREKPFDYSVFLPHSLEELRNQYQALKKEQMNGIIPTETFLMKSQPLAFEIKRREQKLKERS